MDSNQGRKTQNCCHQPYKLEQLALEAWHNSKFFDPAEYLMLDKRMNLNQYVFLRSNDRFQHGLSKASNLNMMLLGGDNAMYWCRQKRADGRNIYIRKWCKQSVDSTCFCPKPDSWREKHLWIWKGID